MAGNGDIPPREGADPDDELERRLRELDWPKPGAGVRDRALAEFERRLAQEAAENPPPAHVKPDE